MILREANSQDSEQISRLMVQLGYDATSTLILSKLEEFRASKADIVVVAEEEGNLIGVISCHITSLFHQAGSSGRITSLVVDDNSHGSGIGKALVSEAEKYFHSMGCVKSEVTSGDHRPEAHKFYEACGYKSDERRFIKKYS